MVRSSRSPPLPTAHGSTSPATSRPSTASRAGASRRSTRPPGSSSTSFDPKGPSVPGTRPGRHERHRVRRRRLRRHPARRLAATCSPCGRRTARCSPGTRTPTTRSQLSPSREDGSAVFAGGSFQNVGGQAGLRPRQDRRRDRRPAAVERDRRGAQRRRRTPASRASASPTASSTAPPTTSAPAATSRARSRSRRTPATLTWAADCHGDTYSSAESNGAVYVVGHSHYCGNVGGGFPQTRDMGLPAGARVHAGRARARTCTSPTAIRRTGSGSRARRSSTGCLR